MSDDKLMVAQLVSALRHLVDELKKYNPGTVYAQAEILLSKLEDKKDEP